jgi:hypothetical protein
MNRALAIGLVVAALTVPSAAPVLAANPPGTGQPSQDCADFFADGQAMPAGFNTGGFANAEAHYAGSPGTPSAMHAHSGAAVSQYDVACFQQASRLGLTH